ncbi:MAG: hypothetical protein IJL52_02360 [Clostridia bacterium]|nr:hypothetical protein [Clostridia bacterium]
MKRKLRSALAMLLALCLVCTAFAVPAFSFGETDIPTVYVQGFGMQIVATAGDENSESYYPAVFPDNFAETVIRDMKQPFLKGMAGNWDDFHQYVIDVFVGLFGKLAPDHNGDVTDGSGTILKGYPVEPNPGQTAFSTSQYLFEFDWRIDPMEVAVTLNDYIERVKEATGYDKVNLIGRCLGNNLLLAYLKQFGYGSVARVAFYCAGFDGFEFFGALYSGNLVIDANELKSYLDTGGRETLLVDQPYLQEALIILVKILNASYILDAGTLALNAYFVPEFQDYILPELLRKTFGACPAMWSFVGDEMYEEAKRYVFGGQEDGWAGLIEKIDRYHYEVMCQTPQIIEDAIAQGIKVYVFTKYGCGMLPLTDDDGQNGDSLVTVRNSSLGATVAPLSGTLPVQYLLQQKKKDGGRYLDPAHQVDASTCLLPDHTWFLRGIYHSTNPECVEQLIALVLRSEEYVTVFDYEEYPQFLKYQKASETLGKDEALKPVTLLDQPRITDRLLTIWKLVPRLLNKLAVRTRTVLRG